MNFPGIFFYKVIFTSMGKPVFPHSIFLFDWHLYLSSTRSKIWLRRNLNYYRTIIRSALDQCNLLHFLISIKIVYQWGRVLNYPVNVALWNCALISSHKAAKNPWQGLAAILLPVMHCMPHNSWTHTQSLRAKFEFSERLGNMTRTNFRKLFGVGWRSMHCITGLDMETKDERQ